MNNPQQKVNLPEIARQVMTQHGFRTEFSKECLNQVAQATEPDFAKSPQRDLSAWLWSSIDNDESRDLDQIEYAETLPSGTRVYVGIANVNYFVPKGSSVDESAQQNTTSIYTGVETFPMLPEKYSTDLSSLVEGQKRLAVVIDMELDQANLVVKSDVYEAIVQNRAQLTYNAVATWLGDPPVDTTPSSESQAVTSRMLAKISADTALQNQLRVQDKVAQGLRLRRHEAGALSFSTNELRPSVLADGRLELKASQPNRATQLIEDFMIAANQATAAFLESHGFPTIWRIVRVPKRWEGIVALAGEHGTTLPATPDSKSLEAFLVAERAKDPEHFPDLSLAIIKLLGRGEYMVKSPQQEAPGHFGLAVENYSHSTAPNRRYPDVLTQRLLLAAMNSQPAPYSYEELTGLAKSCTDKEDEANKVERTVKKSIAAVALSTRVGEIFDAFVTGYGDKGCWVRLANPPVEGKLDGATKGLAVGDRVKVKLTATNPYKGFIDFVLISPLGRKV